MIALMREWRKTCCERQREDEDLPTLSKEGLERASDSKRFDITTKGTGLFSILFFILSATQVHPTFSYTIHPVVAQRQRSIASLRKNRTTLTAAENKGYPNVCGHATPFSVWLPTIRQGTKVCLIKRRNQQLQRMSRLSVVLSSSSDSESSTRSDRNGSSYSQPTSIEPTYKRMILFTATIVLTWLCEPLLSLCDTVIVSRTAHKLTSPAIVQIAALGPATALYNSAIYTTYFLAIATTNQLAPVLGRKNYADLRKLTSHLIGLSIAFGLLITFVMFTFGNYFIGRMVGSLALVKGSETIVPLATKYVRIRAAVAPFSVVGFVAESFCLTILDTKTPALAVLVASVVNIVGDLILAPKYGIQGAAIATALASVSFGLILVNKVRKTTTEWKKIEERQQKECKEEEMKKEVADNVSKDIASVDGTVSKTEITPGNNNIVKSKEITASIPNIYSSQADKELLSKIEQPNVEICDQEGGNQEGKAKSNVVVKDIPFASFPDKKALVDVLKLAGPIFFVMMGNVACYAIMTMRATAFGLESLAAHNIMMSVFFFFACFGDSLGQAAQLFLPQVVINNNSENEEANLQKQQHMKNKVIIRLLYLSVAVGLGNSLVSLNILRNGGLFLSKNAAVIHTMSDFSKYVSGSILIHPFVMLFEGVLLARRDMGFLVQSYLAAFILHFYLVFSSVLSPGSITGGSIQGLWKALLIFKVVQVVRFATRVIRQPSSVDNSEAIKDATL